MWRYHSNGSSLDRRRIFSMVDHLKNDSHHSWLLKSCIFHQTRWSFSRHPATVLIVSCSSFLLSACSSMFVERHTSTTDIFLHRFSTELYHWSSEETNWIAPSIYTVHHHLANWWSTRANPSDIVWFSLNFEGSSPKTNRCFFICSIGCFISSSV